MTHVRRPSARLPSTSGRIEHLKFDETAIGELRGVFRGELLGRHTDGYDSARRVWNGMVDKRPVLIARCTGVADVIAALSFAREHGVLLAVRGGGHNVAGNAVCDDGLVIDLSGLKKIQVDPVRRRARAEPGVLLGELDGETQAFGLATPTGNVSTTGIAGLTLGGGLGWIARKHGTTCDNVVSADVVTADGQLVKASADENPDLFWGLRGGGGNFGVVTSFEYRLHALGPEVLAGAVVHPFERAREVLRFFTDFVATAPDELSVTASIYSAAADSPLPAELHGQTVIALAVCYAGDLDEGERTLRPLRAFGHPLADLIEPVPYTALQSGSDAAYPPGQHNYWKSHYITELTDEAIDAVIEHGPRMPSPLASFYFQHLEGAIGHVGEDEAAFGHRRGAFDFAIMTVWSDPAETDTNIAWTRDLWTAMQPFATGVYVNNLGAEGEDRVRSAYAPATYERLVALKDKYDPTNSFQLNQNIRPSCGTGTLSGR